MQFSLHLHIIMQAGKFFSLQFPWESNAILISVTAGSEVGNNKYQCYGWYYYVDLRREETPLGCYFYAYSVKLCFQKFSFSQ